MKRLKHRRTPWPAGDHVAPPSKTVGGAAALRFRRDRFWGLLLVVAVVLAYLPMRHAGFIWDDDTYITNNATLHSLAGLRQIWFDPGSTVQYYPLTFTTFWVEYHLWGLDPLGYHLLNVLLHACNAVLLWLILRRLAVPGAWLAAALFALHPVNVESVAWVTECKNTLSGLLYLGSLWFALNFWLSPGPVSGPGPVKQKQPPQAGPGDWKSYWLAFVLYVLALCSKTTTLPLPFVILLLVWWKHGKIGWRDLYPLGLFLAAGLAMGLMTLRTENHLGASGPEWGASWLERCLLAGYDVWFYLGKTLWPHPLIFVYPRWTIHTSDWTAYVPVLALGAGLVIAWGKRRAWGRAPLVALLYFIALLFLALGFFNVYYFRYSFVADHFQYLAAIGPLALVAAGIAMTFRRAGAKTPWLGPALSAALLLVLGGLTWRQCRMYAGPESLWQTTLGQNPAAWMAENNLGNFLLQSGRVAEAIGHFQRAGEIKPDDPEAYNNLGNALLQEGRTDDAILQLQKALALQPGYAKAECNLAAALLQKGRVDEAMAQCQELLAAEPGDAQVRCILGTALLRKGQTEAAAAQFKKALAVQPDDAEAHYDLGTALLEEQQTDQAIVQFQKAVALQADYADAYNNLGSALLQQGRIEPAITAYRKALAVQPDQAETRNNLGNALAQIGQTDEAIAQFQTALAVRPDYAEAHYNLGVAFLRKGWAEDAISQFQKALALRPGDADAHYNLGAAFLQNKQWDEAVAQFQAALALRPGFAEAQTGLARIAWMLAASPDPSVRNGTRAVDLAQQADSLSGGANPVIVGALAAADAEAGRFPEAVANAQRALRLAQARTNAVLAATLQAQLKLYQAGAPFHYAAAP